MDETNDDGWQKRALADRDKRLRRDADRAAGRIRLVASQTTAALAAHLQAGSEFPAEQVDGLIDAVTREARVARAKGYAKLMGSALQTPFAEAAE